MSKHQEKEENKTINVTRKTGEAIKIAALINCSGTAVTLFNDVDKRDFCLNWTREISA